MSDFTREWTAICPRCESHLTYADFVCKNCGKGKIKVSVVTSGSGFRALYLGCERCGVSAEYDVKCKCGTSFKNQVKIAGGFANFPVLRSFGRLILFVVIIIIGLVAAVIVYNKFF